MLKKWPRDEAFRRCLPRGGTSAAKYSGRTKPCRYRYRPFRDRIRQAGHPRIPDARPLFRETGTSHVRLLPTLTCIPDPGSAEVRISDHNSTGNATHARTEPQSGGSACGQKAFRRPDPGTGNGSGYRKPPAAPHLRMPDMPASRRIGHRPRASPCPKAGRRNKTTVCPIAQDTVFDKDSGRPGGARFSPWRRRPGEGDLRRVDDHQRQRSSRVNL